MNLPPVTHLDSWHREYLTAVSGREDLAAFAQVWPLAYIEVASPCRAAGDAEALRAVVSDAPHVVLVDSGHEGARFTIAVAERPLSLAEVLPPLQSLSLEVLSEQPFQIIRPDGVTCWLYDFQLGASSLPVDRDGGSRLEDAFRALWMGQAETDTFNRLVVSAGLTWREAAIMRTYGQYLHQLRTPWGRTFTATVLADYAPITKRLSELFNLRFGAHTEAPDADRLQTALRAQIESDIDKVESLTADRVLRRYLNLIIATVRTNFFMTGAPDGHRAIALKFDPSIITVMPKPRPRFEVFVGSPRLEGIHLRFGSVARGGLRWSDRHEDLRTEILGLATAQVAKNAVIVPTGAKGGFVIKRPTAASGPITAEEGPAGYREFIAALLDVHDNLDPATGQPVHAPGTVAYEGGDAYLVVAADKGTATFSDTANDIASSRNFWLGDAFASGGSAGYDHKLMGITAKGAWQSVRRHFLELGFDPHTDTFTAVGIGDMSGDVFGNGMLLSPSMKLVAAFDHRHIFLDPNPDTERSHTERTRLFNLARSSWADYAPGAISTGGGVYPRPAKSIPINSQIRAALGLPEHVARLSPPELISAILAAPVDLLWNGGVGTYVKATTEQHEDAGDKVNDHVRIDATKVRAKVVGEGGNLGFTQRARIEYALAGGRINTDALDNSAGVGCSDREVNIKIALHRLVREGMPEAERLALLTTMTDEVAELVLAQNITQNDVLGQSRQFSRDDLELHSRLIADLEKRGGLDRTQLALPTVDELAQRRGTDQGLSSPELAVLMAQVKLDLRDLLLSGTVPDDPSVQHFLHDYFPQPLRGRYPDAIERHPLRREIIATELANTVVDNAGLGWVHRMLENTNATADDVVRAYLVASTVFDLPALWRRIKSDPVPAVVAGGLIWESTRVLDRASRWLLNRRPQPLDVSAEVARLQPTFKELSDSVPGWHQGTDHVDYLERMEPLIQSGADPELAATVFGLLERFCLLDVAEIAHELQQLSRDIGQLYYAVKERREIDKLLTGISGLPRFDRWSALARLGLRDDLYESIRAITTVIQRHVDAGGSAEKALDAWEQTLGVRLARVQAVIDESRETLDLASLAVAARQVRTLALMSRFGPTSSPATARAPVHSTP
ncbi:MAG: NAD-specific glutamate dehydrogenase [Nocardioides sp.]|nr:NAD-specific glutamate dehydrogenase [Nocardioides sp.]